MTRSKKERRVLRGSMSLADDTWTTTDEEVPLDISKNVGITIHNVKWECPVSLDAAGDKFVGCVSTDEMASEPNMDDNDLISKVSKIAHGVSVDSNVSTIHEDKLYPSQPVFARKLHIGAHQKSGAASTVYYNIVYSLVYMTKEEMMARLQERL